MPISESTRRWREVNKEKLKQQRKVWAERNGFWWRKYRQDDRYAMWLSVRNRARKKSIPFTIRKEDIVIPEYCPVLGIKLARNFGEPGPADHSPSVDRILPELGYIPGNIVVISNRANRIKSNATVEELAKVTAWLQGVIHADAHQN